MAFCLLGFHVTFFLSKHLHRRILNLHFRLRVAACVLKGFLAMHASWDSCAIANISSAVNTASMANGKEVKEAERGYKAKNPAETEATGLGRTIGRALMSM